MPPRKTPAQSKTPAAAEPDPPAAPEAVAEAAAAQQADPVAPADSANEAPAPEDEVASVLSSEDDDDDDDDDNEYYEEDSDGMFDPMQAFSQLLVTETGQTIPDTIEGVRASLDTIAKLLHKLVKVMDRA